MTQVKDSLNNQLSIAFTWSRTGSTSDQEAKPQRQLESFRLSTAQQLQLSSFVQACHLHFAPQWCAPWHFVHLQCLARSWQQPDHSALKWS